MAFPIFWIWSAPATSRPWRILRWIGLALLVGLHLHLTRNFVLSRWAG
jgi:hypothetical protein